MRTRTGGRHRRNGGGRVARSLVAGALVAALLTANATHSAFSGRTTSPGNQLNAGTVVLTDNSAGQTLMTVTGLRPGVAPSRCVKVVYEGTLNSTIRLFGATTGGTGLEDHLMVSVTRGAGVTGTFPACTGFTADTTDYNLLGPGVLYSGTLAGYPSGQATGLTDPKLNWATNEAHWYQLTVDVLDPAAARGRSATASFTWDARA
ncbi:hypothetical protein [Actinoplanes sp. URMC 104]|uniref:hypothetical protein n=1 Tax=Actinoplanes sp. URMC 104 TaxID=3423409 RepID=UPI003F1DF691